MPLTSHTVAGLSDWPRLLIQCHTKFLSSHPKPTLKNHLLHYTMNYIHRFTNISCFSPKQNTALPKMLLRIKAYNASGAYKNLLHIVQKVFSLGMVWCTLKEDMLTRLLTSPTTRTFLRPTLLSTPAQFLKKPMGTWMELKTQSRRGGVPFTYFRYSSNPTPHFNSI